MKKVTIYTDGSARGNPGPGGYGAILEYVDCRGNTYTKEISAGYENTTNNRMELMAALRSLECLSVPCEVILYSDSKYLVDAFNQKWIENWQRCGWKKSDNQMVKNIDLWKSLLIAKKPHKVTFCWVKGHSGNSKNERCDQLATMAADNIQNQLRSLKI